MTQSSVVGRIETAGPPRALDIPTGTLAIARRVLDGARRAVRSRTRSDRYFAHTDRFARAFLGGPLGVPPALSSTLGSDLPALLDTCYEDTLSLRAAAIPALLLRTSRFTAALDLPAALRMLASASNEIDEPERSFGEIATWTLAALTVLGFAAMESRASHEAAWKWLSLWRSRTVRHNAAQLSHTAISLVRRRDVPVEALARAVPPSLLDGWPHGTTFASGVKEYLAQFADTSGGSMALCGAIPFSEDLSGDGAARLGDWLASTPHFLFAIDSALRLAQDVSFDAEEPLSSAVAGVAAKLGLPVTSVALLASQRAAIEEDLHEHWLVHEASLRDALSSVLINADVDHEQRHRLLTIVEVTFSIARALTSAPHKG